MHTDQKNIWAKEYLIYKVNFSYLVSCSAIKSENQTAVLLTFN